MNESFPLLAAAFLITGAVVLLTGKRFPFLAKMASGSAFAAIVFLNACSPSTPGQSASKEQSTLAKCIPFKVLGEAGSTALKGQWQVEVGLVDGRLPQPNELSAIVQSFASVARELKSTHQRYFVEFSFPGMNEKNGGSKTGYALGKLDPAESTEPLIRVHHYHSDNWPEEFRGLPIPKGNWDSDISSAGVEASVGATVKPIAGANRSAICEGTLLFMDRDAILEINAASVGVSEAERKANWEAVDKRLRAQRRVIFAPSNLAVRVQDQSPEVSRYREVTADNQNDMPKGTFWVHQSSLKDNTTLIGSQILGAEMLFDGTRGMAVENADISSVIDLVEALYDGKISDKAASRCVFTSIPNGLGRAQVLNDFVIYYVWANSRRKLKFAMPKVDGNDDPLAATPAFIPIRFKEWRDFRSENGQVLSAPVMITHSK